MTTAYKNAIVSRRVTPQTAPIPDKNMVKNNAGGYVFDIGPMATFRRFLIIGSEGNTYYASSAKMTEDNTKNIRELFEGGYGVDAIELLTDVSDRGLAPKVSPTLYALALAFASKNLATKHAARLAFGTVVRTHSHLLEFISYANELRGWGRMLKETVAHWYNNKDANDLGYQLAKYRNRSGWTTADALRVAHPKPEDEAHNALYKWAVGKGENHEFLPTIVKAHVNAMGFEKPNPYYILQEKLTHEMIPNTWLNDPEVWEALLQNMPMTAMIRNLAKMTSVGLITPFSNASKLVQERLHDVEYLKKSRIHPMSVLLAYTTYKSGRGVKGSLTWTGVAQVTDALEDAFYASFHNVEPTNKNTLIGLDISGSMGYGNIAGTHLMPNHVSAALAMVAVRTEPNYMVGGFSTMFKNLGITAKDTLDSAMRKVVSNTFGGTDTAVAINYALNNKIPVDNFLIITDNETWAGPIHASQAIKQYRQKTGINARVAVMAVTATNFSIADPADSGMMDIVGFDASAPQILRNFYMGDI